MTTSKLLLVDDEQNNRNAIIRLFEDYDFSFVEAGDGKEALEEVRKQSFDLILLDIKMPVMDGFGFLAQFSETIPKPRPPVCVMTAFSDAETRRKSIYLGADDFINKPFDPIELETRIVSLLRISHYQQDLNSFNRRLEELVAERTQQLQATCEKLKETEKQNARAYRDMISRIAKLASYGHGPVRPDLHKLGLCTAALGWICGIPTDEAENLSLSALVYNIGLLALPDKLRETPMELLNKEQLVVLLSYTSMGAEIFKDATSNLLRQAHNICLYHREHYDGTGHPHGKKASEIPLEARLLTTAQLIVETQERFPENTYRHVENALRDHAGTLLDPTIVDMLLENPETFGDLLEQLAQP